MSKYLSKIRKSAKGEECQIRLPGICNWDPATTVLAHKNGGGGGMKSPDYMGAYSCSSCHDAVDGRDIYPLVDSRDIQIWFYEGIFRTQIILNEKGLLRVGNE